MSKPKTLPDNVKAQCIAIVRDYPRLIRMYHEGRRNIIEGSPSRYTTVKLKVPTGETDENGALIYSTSEYREHNARGGGDGRGLEDKARKLEEMEDWYIVRQMRAVERAKYLTGRDLPDQLRQKLVDGIVLNCESGRRYPYELLDVPTVGRNEFYHYRRDFLVTIAQLIKLI